MTADPYDRIPYHSHPFPKSRPAYLYTVARLFGLDPPPWPRARVLELGCGGGGNLIPLAMAAPEGRFLGLDRSAGQLTPGRRLIEALELTNIELHQLSIATVDDRLGQFDYIICHGVWSWVDAPLRDKILAVCRERLTPSGVAYISYNCRPGWNMIQSIRDMMLFHVDGITDPVERAEQARSMLHFILDGNPEADSAYAAYLRSELEMLAEHHDAYLLHDHLERVNHPAYFHEFIAQAESHGLAYLAEADLPLMYIGNLEAPARKVIGQIQDIVRAEQYMDFLRNRRFRCTLLCHQERPIRRHLSPDDIHGFFLSTRAASETAPSPEDLDDDRPVTFRCGDQRLTLRNRVAKTAMDILCTRRRRPIAYADLVAETRAKVGAPRADTVREALDNELELLRLVFAGIVDIDSTPPRFTYRIDACPRACGLARAQAARQEVITNRRHEAVALNEAERFLILLLNGQTPIDVLERRLAEAVGQGELVLNKDGRPVTSAAAVAEAMHRLCKEILADLAANALLVDGGEENGP